jgi:hypothetical protein
MSARLVHDLKKAPGATAAGEGGNGSALARLPSVTHRLLFAKTHKLEDQAQ